MSPHVLITSCPATASEPCLLETPFVDGSCVRLELHSAGLQPAMSAVGIPNRQAPPVSGAEPVDPSTLDQHIQEGDAQQPLGPAQTPRYAAVKTHNDTRTVVSKQHM